MATPAHLLGSAADPITSKSTSELVDTLPCPPFIPLPGVPNLRAIVSYYSVLYPNHTARGQLIFRSAQPGHITPEAAVALREDLNVRTIFDLRSTLEIKNSASFAPVKEIEGIERVEVPVFGDDEWGPSRGDSAWRQYTDPIDPEVGHSRGFVEGYKRILDAGAEGGSYERIFRHLLESGEEGGGILVHCTAGKDRTGVFCALVLKLCGVADEVIAQEYELTEIGLGEWKEVIIEKLTKTHMDKEGLPEKEMKEKVERMVGAKGINMLAFLKWLDAERGGVEGYLRKGVGLTEVEVEDLRKLLLVKEDAWTDRTTNLRGVLERLYPRSAST